MPSSGGTSSHQSPENTEIKEIILKEKKKPQTKTTLSYIHRIVLGESVTFNCTNMLNDFAKKKKNPHHVQLLQTYAFTFSASLLRGVGGWSATGV